MEKEKIKETYKEYATRKATRTPLFKNVARAFLCGGSVCLLGQAMAEVYILLGVKEDDAFLLSSICLIFLAILLTGIGIFDDLASFAGAGTLVPITGFANAMSSPAIDSKSEGFVLGVGAKIFTVAGPVILFGTAASVIYGVIYWITTLF